MNHYFDHNSCTPVDPRVLDRFADVETSCPGNPGSLHTAGRRARGVVEEARFDVAEVLGVEVDHVYFVSGGTEANNLAVLGIGDRSLPVLCSVVEHPSVLKAAERRGSVTWQVDAGGCAIVTDPSEQVGLIAIVHGQNEVGGLQPIAAAAALAAELTVPLHVDASQTLGRHPVDDVVQLADSITFSTHKAAGLRGMAVFIDRGEHTAPLFFGGGQQRNRRPGTESPSLAAATAFALRLAIEEQEQRAVAMRAARDAFAGGLQGLADARRLTPEDSLPNTLMYHFAGIDGRELLPGLDMAGVEASQGSACSAGAPTPPLVLTAMGLTDDEARACARFSFSAHTGSQPAAAGAAVVRCVIQQLRARS